MEKNRATLVNCHIVLVERSHGDHSCYRIFPCIQNLTPVVSDVDIGELGENRRQW